VVPAGASAATSQSAKKRPAITRVTPMRVRVGAVLTIRGRNFSSKRRRNTVIFRASNGRTAFAKPTRASRRKLVVRVPTAAARLLGRRASRFRIRVLTNRRFSRFTSRRLSPVLVPSNVGSIEGGAPGLSCPAGDADGDLLAATLEATLKTDPCLPDTDRDGIEDGFEYRSAVDLNNDEYQQPNQSLPYPGKRPYPNPLDPSDGGLDYDGDSLGQNVEQRLWKYSTTSPRSLSALTYSDGLQHSIYRHLPGQGDRRYPALPAVGYSKDTNFDAWASASGYRNVYVDVHHPAKPAGVYSLFDQNLDGVETNAERHFFDRDGDGYLSDDERDEDADALANADENSRRLVPSWWKACYSDEGPYYVPYAGTNIADPDTDGDGVRDGADDQDHDDVPNVMELSRIAASGINDTEQNRECKIEQGLEESLGAQEPPIYHHNGSYGRLNPFNPCLPDKNSRTCNRNVSFTSPWAPFDDSVDWLSLN
jgi:hypothetical protein